MFNSNPVIDQLKGTVGSMNPMWAEWLDRVKAASPDGEINLAGPFGNTDIGRGLGINQSKGNARQGTPRAAQPTSRTPTARQPVAAQRISATPRANGQRFDDPMYAPAQTPPSMLALSGREPLRRDEDMDEAMRPMESGPNPKGGRGNDFQPYGQPPAVPPSLAALARSLGRGK